MSRTERILIAAAGGSLVLALAAGWLLVAPVAGPDDGPPLLSSATDPPAPGFDSATEPPGTQIVVDVAGAVERPGIHRLPAGSRVADAISAAGGYGLEVDLEAATSINLARPLEDGEQVRVPARGESVAAGGEGSGGPDTSSGPIAGGLVDINTASPEELQGLPGIGPVTAQKIVAARQERPFTSLEEAVERKVMNRGQLEQIRELATTG